MFRRDFFKMLTGAAVSAVCAPLVKLLPKRQSETKFVSRLRIGSTINIRKPVRFFVKEDLALSEKDFVEHFVRPRFKLALDAEEKDRALALDDLVAIVRQTDEDTKAITGLTDLNGPA